MRPIGGLEYNSRCKDTVPNVHLINIFLSPCCQALKIFSKMPLSNSSIARLNIKVQTKRLRIVLSICLQGLARAPRAKYS